MNGKLVLKLSLFGIAMGLATTDGIVTSTEPLFWLLTFALYPLLIARHATGHYFLHGFLVNLANGTWIGLVHAALLSTYEQHHPAIMQWYRYLPHEVSLSTLVLLSGPVLGALLGLMNGCFTVFTYRML